ncbi:DedA family protein [Alkalicoccobacillus gibsonii]|uniref:DedA family protein n=1 Tax=Alkalicoccobacillus gibsonii TaxID=79881 RepID=UPI003F7B5C08
MDWISEMINYVSPYGYTALFICFAIGLFIFPVPNEVLLMTGGWMVTLTYVEPLPTFLTIFAAVICHGTIWYSIGARMNRTVLNQNRFGARWKQRAEDSTKMINRHGKRALLFSYYLPFVRHAVPLGVGASSIRYVTFATYAFLSASIWVGAYFSIGYFFGQMIGQIQYILEHVTYIVLVGCVALAFFVYRKVKKDELDKMVQKI